MSTYTVWVGGSEMSENVLALSQASKIADVWRGLGYEDVIIEEVTA